MASSSFPSKKVLMRFGHPGWSGLLWIITSPTLQDISLERTGVQHMVSFFLKETPIFVVSFISNIMASTNPVFCCISFRLFVDSFVLTKVIESDLKLHQRGKHPSINLSNHCKVQHRYMEVGKVSCYLTGTKQKLSISSNNNRIIKLFWLRKVGKKEK